MSSVGKNPLLGPSAASAGRKARTALVYVLLALATVAVYWPVTFNAFTNYDDDAYVTSNLYVQRGLTWKGLAWGFYSIHGEHTYWHPLTWLSHMLDCQWFGLKAGGHHFINLLFHTLNTLLVFLVFQRITGAFWRCAILAGLFALHPLQVDTVAWIAERKNLLSALFWLLTIWAYSRYVAEIHQNADVRRQEPVPLLSRRARPWYVLCLCLFALGLMCKPVLVTLPFVLLLLDYWPLRRFELNPQLSTRNAILPLLREKLPFFALAVVSCFLTVQAHRGLGMLDASSGFSLDLRIENAVVSYVRYLAKTMWPSQLAVFYPYPSGWVTWKVVASGLLLLSLSVVAIGNRRRRPYLFVGWYWFLGVLVPFIGLVQAGAQAMADRFAYVPLVGLFLALVWGVHELASRWRCRMAVLFGAGLVVALVCVTLTRRQISYWKEDESLFSHALAVTENNGLAQLNLGAALNVKGRFDEAIVHFREAIRLAPGTPNAHINLAYALAQRHQFAEAIREYETALRLTPGDAALHNDLGLTLARNGQAESAIQHYKEALRLKPGFTEAHYNLGLTLTGLGDSKGAVVQFQEAMRLNPNNAKARQALERMATQEAKSAMELGRGSRLNPGPAQARYERGRVLLEADQVDEAIKECAEAVRLEPKSAEAQYQLGAALARKGDEEKAARQFEVALELDPKLAAAHYALGVIAKHQWRPTEALKHWREAVRLSPQWPDPLNNLAWMLATYPQADLRDGVEAVKLAAQAVQLAGTNNVGVMDTLAAAYAEAGQFAEATSTAQAAYAAAMAQGQAGLAEEIRLRLAGYESQKPYRQEPSYR